VVKYISDNGLKVNDYLIHVSSILDSLTFNENSSNQFEQALKDTASVIGICSSRP